MLKIGDFSKMTRISVRMLHHYDEIGLLKPQRVDDFTGYRYYEEQQLLEAGRIRALREMGFGLSSISVLLSQYQNAQEIEAFLRKHRAEMEAQAQEIQRKLVLIDSTLCWLGKDGKMSGYDVTLKVLPEQYVASVRQVLPSYEEEGLLWKVLMEETAPLGMRDGSPCYTRAIFHDGEFKERDVDVEVQKSVQGTYPDTEHVKFKTVPPIQIASAIYKGCYEQISEVNGAVAKWICDNGYELDGLFFNIYHVSPYETQNPEEFVTEVCYPVKKREPSAGK